MSLALLSFRSIKLTGGSRITTASKIEFIMVIVNGWEPLSITTMSSTLDVAAGLALPLKIFDFQLC